MHTEGHESAAPLLKTHQHQGTKPWNFRTLRTREEPTTFRGRKGHIRRTGNRNGFRLTPPGGRGQCNDAFKILKEKNFLSAKIFPDICGLIWYLPNDPFRKLPENTGHLVRV